MTYTAITKALIAVAILSLFLASSAQAQILRANVPFEFGVDDKVFPAGDYSIRTEPIAGGMTLSIPGGREEAFLVTIPLTWKPEVENGMLVFSKYGKTCFLSRFKAPGASAGHELITSKAEREMMARSGEARHLAMIRIVNK
jgi:hypothetical protein